MISITSLRRTITRTAHQSGSSSALTVGELKPGVIFSASRQLGPRHVVFQQRIAAGDDHAFEPADDAVGQLGVPAGRVLDQHRLVAADLVQDPQPIGRQRAAGFDQIDDRVGHAQRDHDLDRAGQIDQVGLGLVLCRDTAR